MGFCPKCSGRKGQFLLELRDNREAEKTYMYVASNLSQGRVELVNLFLVFAAACQILLGSEEDAQNYLKEAVKNATRSTKPKAWSHVLCDLCVVLLVPWIE